MRTVFIRSAMSSQVASSRCRGRGPTGAALALIAICAFAPDALAEQPERTQEDSPTAATTKNNSSAKKPATDKNATSKATTGQSGAQKSGGSKTAAGTNTAGTQTAVTKTSEESTRSDAASAKTAPTKTSEESTRSDTASAKTISDPSTAGMDDAEPQGKKRLDALTLPPRLEGVRRDVSTELREKPIGKIGPFMANTKLGPAIGIGGQSLTASAQADFGYAFVKGDGRGLWGGDVYAVASPELQFGSALVLTLPIGVQYDIPTPVAGLYVYPRLTAGYSLVLDPADGVDDTVGDAFTVIPAAGAKYVVNQVMNFGLEPAVLPLYLGNGEPVLEYRIFGYAGMNL